ncbi:MAG TPA: gamma-glutamylcyclotransferase family protein [Acidimicrobiales bacterium]|jgi:gamma-glutamylcyclotransferase (GGCT)/AIG2-like uncharacterized protein YtfP
MDATYLAVYGTLRSGLALPEQPPELAELLSDRGPCVLAGVLHDLGAYPGLRTGAGRVAGELYELDDPASVFDILDVYEGFDSTDPERSLYLRRRVPLLEPALEAWVYFYNREPDPMSVISSGDWMRSQKDERRCSASDGTGASAGLEGAAERSDRREHG